MQGWRAVWRGTRRLVLASALGLSLSGPAGAELILDWGQINDPRIREPLFELYDESYFSGIIRLSVNRNFTELGDEQTLADLVLAALYMGYGMPERCRELLLKLDDRRVSSPVQYRLWYYLAKYYYQRGIIDKAQLALTQVNERQLGELHSDYLLLRAELEAPRAPNRAIKTLKRIKSEDKAIHFANYNRAVLLMRQDKMLPGIRILRELSNLNTLDQDLLALSERASMTLARHFLKTNNPGEAKNFLSLIRLESPLTRQALLGLGWSYAGLQDFESALAAWEELGRQDISDPLVLEAHIAKGYALSKLKSTTGAMEQYEKTTVMIKTEMRRISSIQESIRNGIIMDTIIDREPLTEAGWFADMTSLPDIPARPYLVEFFSSHRFQEAYKQHRDLKYLAGQLRDWTEAMQRYDGLSNTFRESYMKRIIDQQARLSALQDKSRAYLEQITLEYLDQRRGQLDELLKQARFQLAQILDQLGRGAQ